MRILLVNYEFPPIGGGSSTASFSIARELVRLDDEVTVLTSRYGGSPKLEEIEGVVIHRVPSWRKGVHDCGIRGAATFLLAALPQMQRLIARNRFQIVHYFFSLPTGLLSLYSYGVRGIPYVVSLRGSDVPHYDTSSLKLRALHRCSLNLTHWIWRHAARVVAVSDSLRDLARSSFPDVDVEVIHNGVYGRTVATPDNTPRRTAPLRLVCVARLIPRKGIADLLHAMARLRDLDIELKLAGSGESELELGALAAEIGVRDRVEFLGYQNEAEIRRLNASADVFVLPTHSEAFANAILEGMSAGLPVIATDVGGAREAIEHGVNGLLVRPRDPAALAEAVRTLAGDADLRRRMSHANVARIEREFTWSSVARRYHRIYVDALAAAPARASG